MVGQVSTTADALGSLNMGPTQKDHGGSLVDIFWCEPTNIWEKKDFSIKKTPKKPKKIKGNDKHMNYFAIKLAMPSLNPIKYFAEVGHIKFL